MNKELKIDGPTLMDIYNKYTLFYCRNGSSVEGSIGTSDLIKRVDMPEAYFCAMFEEISKLCKNSVQLTRQETIKECIEVIHDVGNNDKSYFNGVHKGFMFGINRSISALKLINQQNND